MPSLMTQEYGVIMAIENLSDKIVFITGAASGIGAAIARAFAGQGCKVVLADLGTWTQPGHALDADRP